MSSYSAFPFDSDPAHPVLSAIWAVLVHGVIALVVVAPLLLGARHRLLYSALAFIGGSLLDVDHVVAANSFNVHAIETLANRPATHSLLFVVLLALLMLALTRRPTWAWSVFAVNAVHLLFDGAGGSERFFYPLSHDDGLPWLAFPIGMFVLFLGSVAVARIASTRAVYPAVIDPQAS